MKVFVTRIIPEIGLDIIKSKFDVEVWEDEQPPSKGVLIDKAKSDDALLTLLTDPIDAEVIDACQNVKVISQMAVGYNNIDVKRATEKRIIVTNTPGVLTDTTADFTWSLLTAIARRVPEADQYVRNGKWVVPWGPLMMVGGDIHHKTLGIIGMGRIGSAVAKRAQGFGMKILYYDIRPNKEVEEKLNAKKVNLDKLLSTADFVTIHTVLNEATRNLINWEQLKKMKKTAYLINTSRGPVVNQKDLARALNEHIIAGAALDVFHDEPVHLDDPLLKLDNIVLAPHIASASIDTRSKMARMAAENLMSVLQGRIPPYPVNRELAEQILK